MCDVRAWFLRSCGGIVVTLTPWLPGLRRMVWKKLETRYWGIVFEHDKLEGELRALESQGRHCPPEILAAKRAKLVQLKPQIAELYNRVYKIES